MNNKDLSDLGDQIRETVQGAIDSMDFKQLNRDITDSVNSALGEARKQLKNYSQAVNKQPATVDRQPAAANKQPIAVKKRPVSVKMEHSQKAVGLCYAIFGGIGLGTMGLLVFLSILVSVAMDANTVISVTVIGLLSFLALLFGVMLRTGISIQNRLKRLRLYLNTSDGKAYCTIKSLSVWIGKDENFVVKDLKWMICKGLLPEAHIDEKKTHLIFDHETYKQYLQTQESLKQRELKEKMKKKQLEKEEIRQTPQSKLEMMISEGEDAVRILREANDAIPGEIISQKLYRLEIVLGKIFDTVKKYPDQVEEMQKFMEYYLPTTIKLVNAYREFDGITIQGDNITSAKHEIEQTLDTINQAFERLLDDLYQDAVFDISTDASVLQTMLAKDGWTSHDFK